MRWLRALVSALLISTLVVVALDASPASAQSPPANGPKKSGKLSPRLTKRAAAPSDRAAPNAAAALPDTGPGSPVVMPDGRLVVEVKVQDTSAATLDALRAAGAEVLAVGDATLNVSAAIDPGALQQLGAVAAVRYVSEALAPKSHATCP